MDSGDGTIGLLLNDPTLYEDLKRLVGGAQRSAVVRTLIRMSADEDED
jgi:phospholipid/cholesterol/gamma-HCH transport system substrate-binding protein